MSSGSYHTAKELLDFLREFSHGEQVHPEDYAKLRERLFTDPVIRSLKLPKYILECHDFRDLKAFERNFRDNKKRKSFADHIQQTFNPLLEKLERTLPEPLDAALAVEFSKIDDDLKSLLATAVRKFKSPDLETRKESLEKLWDTWERLKTAPYPHNKKEGIKILIEAATPDKAFQERLDQESRWLTGIGNDFQIRHWEVGKTPLTRELDVDYLFYRLFVHVRFLILGAGDLLVPNG